MSCKWIGNYKYFETEQSKQHINEYEFGKDIYEIYTKNRKVIACLSLNCIQKIKISTSIYIEIKRMVSMKS